MAKPLAEMTPAELEEEKQKAINLVIECGLKLERVSDEEKKEKEFAQNCYKSACARLEEVRARVEYNQRVRGVRQ